jgi:drug/metabolite transporter (DMT)-like permease
LKLWPVYGALLGVQLLFATLPVAVKFALRELSSPSVALIRVTGAALLFLLLQRVLSGARIRGAGDYARLALYGFFGVVVNQLLYITALTMTTATAATTLITAGPAFTLAIAIVLGRETASPAKWAGIALAAAVALLIVGVRVDAGQLLGNAMVLGNVLAFSVYLVISRDILRRYDALTVITWTFVFGALGIAPWGIPSLLAETGGLSSTAVGALAWIVLVPTVTAYYLNVWALARVEASVVAVYVYLQPIVAAGLAAWLLGERPSPWLVPAGLLIFSGVAVTAWAGHRARIRRGAMP